MAPPRREILTAKQEAAILALLDGQSQAQAAKTVGVGERTLKRWMADDRFLAAYREARREKFSTLFARINKVALSAATLMNEFVEGRITPLPGQAQTAHKAVDQAIKVSEQIDLAERVEALEREIETIKATAEAAPR